MSLSDGHHYILSKVYLFMYPRSSDWDSSPIVFKFGTTIPFHKSSDNFAGQNIDIYCFLIGGFPPQILGF